MQKHKPDSVPLAIASLFVRFLDCAIIAMGIFQLEVPIGRRCRATSCRPSLPWRRNPTIWRNRPIRPNSHIAMSLTAALTLDQGWRLDRSRVRFPRLPGTPAKKFRSTIYQRDRKPRCSKPASSGVILFLCPRSGYCVCFCPK